MCKTFIGSVEEMKGNEARVVFFLHPVDQVKDGKVAKVEPLKNSVGIISLLLLALLLGLGVLIYLFFTLKADPSQPEPVSTTETNSESTTSEPVSVTTQSTEATSEEPRENKSTTESGPFMPGKNSTQKRREQQLTTIYRNLNAGKLYSYCLGILPIGCILKPPTCVYRLPRPEVHLLKVQAGARMDKEAYRKASQGGEDALAHSSILPCHHKIFL